MIFEEGFTKKYESLRYKNPSVYYLEDFYYKILPINIDGDFNVYINNRVVPSEEKVITVNFPEFLDVSKNLELIKSIFFKYDLSLNKSGAITPDSEESTINMISPGDAINSKLFEEQTVFTGMSFKPYPEGMLKLYLGYRYVAVYDPKIILEDGDSLCCKQLLAMEDNCFEWYYIPPGETVKLKTTKATVCKFKVEINKDLFLTWLRESLTDNRMSYFLKGMKSNSIDFNFILHPPYISRMSFKDNIKIVYPLQTTKLKTLEKVSFRANRSYTINNKIYIISFIDKDTNQILFSFDTIEHSYMFSNILGRVDTSQVNSLMSPELKTFEDGVLIEFSIPNNVQLALAKHKNYKIQIKAKDLTTQER